MWSHSNNCEFITTSCQHGTSICCCINAPDLFSDCIKTSLCVFLSVICCHMFRFSFLKSIKRIEKFPQSSFFSGVRTPLTLISRYSLWPRTKNFRSKLWSVTVDLTALCVTHTLKCVRTHSGSELQSLHFTVRWVSRKWIKASVMSSEVMKTQLSLCLWVTL